MAAATSMSQSAVSRIRQPFGLNTHLVQTWKLGTDLQFAESANRKLRRSAHRSVTELEADIRRWTSARPPFARARVVGEILSSLAANLQQINEPKH